MTSGDSKKHKKKKTIKIIYINTVGLLIPETHVRATVTKEEFNKIISEVFKYSKKIKIYKYNGLRYLFFEDNFVIEEKDK